MIFAFLAILMLSSFLVSAGAQTLTLSGDRVGDIQNKRFEKKEWGQKPTSSVANKRFPIKEWDKHFSPVGGKRAPIDLESTREKKIFETKTVDQKRVDFGMSRWNRDLAELHEKAGIQMDDKARIAGKQELYTRMIQNAEDYKDTGEVLSLRDINRYQFRRNRSEGALPVTAAGSN